MRKLAKKVPTADTGLKKVTGSKSSSQEEESPSGSVAAENIATPVVRQDSSGSQTSSVTSTAPPITQQASGGKRKGDTSDSSSSSNGSPRPTVSKAPRKKAVKREPRSSLKKLKLEEEDEEEALETSDAVQLKLKSADQVCGGNFIQGTAEDADGPVVMVDLEIVREFKKICKNYEGPQPLRLSMGTFGNAGGPKSGLFITHLVLEHPYITRASHGAAETGVNVPFAAMLHKGKDPEVYQMLLDKASEIFHLNEVPCGTTLIWDLELDPAPRVWDNCKIILCWNHMKEKVCRAAKRHGSRLQRDDLKQIREDVHNLLVSKNEETFIDERTKLFGGRRSSSHDIWRNKSFQKHFMQSLDGEIRNCAGGWKLAEAGIENPTNGITNNRAKTASASFHRIRNKTEMTIPEAVLCYKTFVSHTAKELKKAYFREGDMKLKSEYHHRLVLPINELPAMNYKTFQEMRKEFQQNTSHKTCKDPAATSAPEKTAPVPHLKIIPTSSASKSSSTADVARFSQYNASSASSSSSEPWNDDDSFQGILSSDFDIASDSENSEDEDKKDVHLRSRPVRSSGVEDVDTDMDETSGAEESSEYESCHEEPPTANDQEDKLSTPAPEKSTQDTAMDNLLKCLQREEAWYSDPDNKNAYRMDDDSIFKIAKHGFTLDNASLRDIYLVRLNPPECSCSDGPNCPHYYFLRKKMSCEVPMDEKMKHIKEKLQAQQKEEGKENRSKRHSTTATAASTATSSSTTTGATSATDNPTKTTTATKTTISYPQLRVPYKESRRLRLLDVEKGNVSKALVKFDTIDFRVALKDCHELQKISLTEKQACWIQLRKKNIGLIKVVGKSEAILLTRYEFIDYGEDLAYITSSVIQGNVASTLRNPLTMRVAVGHTTSLSFDKKSQQLINSQSLRLGPKYKQFPLKCYCNTPQICDGHAEKIGKKLYATCKCGDGVHEECISKEKKDEIDLSGSFTCAPCVARCVTPGLKWSAPAPPNQKEGIQIKNTCTIDNFLTGLALFTELQNPDLILHFPDDQEHANLIGTLQLVKRKKYNQAQLKYYKELAEMNATHMALDSTKAELQEIKKFNKEVKRKQKQSEDIEKHNKMAQKHNNSHPDKPPMELKAAIKVPAKKTITKPIPNIEKNNLWGSLSSRVHLKHKKGFEFNILTSCSNRDCAHHQKALKEDYEVTLGHYMNRQGGVTSVAHIQEILLGDEFPCLGCNQGTRTDEALQVSADNWVLSFDCSSLTDENQKKAKVDILSGLLPETITTEKPPGSSTAEHYGLATVHLNDREQGHFVSMHWVPSEKEFVFYDGLAPEPRIRKLHQTDILKQDRSIASFEYYKIK